MSGRRSDLPQQAIQLYETLTEDTTWNQTGAFPQLGHSDCVLETEVPQLLHLMISEGMMFAVLLGQLRQ